MSLKNSMKKSQQKVTPEKDSTTSERKALTTGRKISSLSRVDHLSSMGPIDDRNLLKDNMEIQEIDEEQYVVDPDFSSDFVDKIDEHIKIMVITIMFMATLIWSVFFYSWHHLPDQIFAKEEIQLVFNPKMIWSGIYMLIVCPWLSSLYCLFLVVYPDPRTWRYCCRPRRVWRWVPYIVLLMYTVIVIAFWLYRLFLIPTTIHKKMVASIRKSLNHPTTKFPSNWEYLQNYYQCCGIKSKDDWTHKTIPTAEIPFPFKKDQICKIFFYGKHMHMTQTCSQGNFSQLGILWPASCCNLHSTTTGCTTLPTSTQTWTGHCFSAEISLALATIIIAMVLSIIILILGVFAFFKTRILETVALRQKLQPPKPHF